MPDDALFGFKERLPSESELAYFRSQPSVAGMASEDGKIVMNPFAPETVNRDAVRRNEAFRLLLRKRNVQPEFQLTEAQKARFTGTAYEDERFLKQTIAARIYSGDPSAEATEEQKRWVREFLTFKPTPYFDYPKVGARAKKPGEPIINPDGSKSTEQTISVEFDDGIYVIPTIVVDDEGFLVKVSEDQAIELFKSGKNNAVGKFNSEKEAEAFAKARSAAGGRFPKKVETPLEEILKK